MFIHPHLSARTVRLLGGLCALLVFAAVGRWICANPVVEKQEVPHITGTASESTIGPLVTSTWIRVDPFLLDVPSFWRQDAVPDPCPARDPLPILVLPHYIPLYSRMQRTLATWKACAREVSIRRVIIASPDHHQRLAGGAVTFSGSGFQTPLGEAPVDGDVRSSLVANGVRAVEALFREEHGVGVFPIFIKQAFPEATMVPIVISAHATQAEIEALGELLRPVLDDGSTLLIISADFSHYLTRPQADRHDQEMMAAFRRRDGAFIWAAQDAHTDFGRGLWLGMRLADGAPFFRFERANSAEIGGPAARTTSFWFGWWER